MLRADPHLPFLEIAWSDRRLLEFFNTAVLPAVSPGEQAIALERTKVLYEPGCECAMFVEVELADGASWQALVNVADGRVLRDAYARHYAGSNGAGSPALLLEQHGCLVELFPADWRLPGLSSLVDTRRAAPLLEACAGRPNGALRDVKLLRYMPHRRAVARYTLEGRQDIVGKAFGSTADLERTWGAMSRLHPQGAALGIATPQPLAKVDDETLIFMSAVPGVSWKTLLKRAKAGDDAVPLVGLAAEALAAMHAFDFESAEVRSLESDARAICQRAAGLDLIAPLFARRADDALERIGRSLPGYRQERPTFVHGDFAPSQVLVEGGRPAVVDFDRACLGDPAMDAGNFMAKLYRKGVAKAEDRYRPLAARFLAEYDERLPAHRVPERAHAFLSLSLVRIAIDTLRRSPRAYGRQGEASLPARLLDEATACLARPFAGADRR